MSFLDKIKSWFGGGSAPAAEAPPAKKEKAPAKAEPVAEAEPAAEAEAEEPKPDEAAE